MDRWFVNLTSGIDGISKCALESYEYVRIKSTMAYLGDWNEIIRMLDYNFLMRLAQGDRCTVIDASGREMSDAMRVALPWIRYVLNRCWYGIIPNEPQYDPHYNGLTTWAIEKVNLSLIHI